MSGRIGRSGGRIVSLGCVKSPSSSVHRRDGDDHKDDKGARPSPTAPWLINQPMNRVLFETYVETQLAPTLRPGDVVILDNLSSHKSEKAKAILKEAGAWFLSLPPYSPDLNPIEMAFAKLKAHLRRMGARTIDDLWRAIGNICDLYHPDECWNYLKAAGYAFD